VRLTGSGRGSVERELANLTESGIIVRESRGREVYYWADKTCPIFNDLKSIMVKSAGIADVLKFALAPLADNITCAFVYGSFANGTEGSSSDIDLMVVGGVDEIALHKAIRVAEKNLGREVNYTLLEISEMKKRLRDKNGFMSRVMSGARIFIIGDADEI